MLAFKLLNKQLSCLRFTSKALHRWYLRRETTKGLVDSLGIVYTTCWLRLWNTNPRGLHEFIWRQRPINNFTLVVTQQIASSPGGLVRLRLKTQTNSGWHRAFDELSFGEFAQESSAFFGAKKLRKWSHDIWSYLDLLRSCIKQSVHAIHDLKDKNTVNKMQ